jgi:hypothetical protein
MIIFCLKFLYCIAAQQSSHFRGLILHVTRVYDGIIDTVR